MRNGWYSSISSEFEKNSVAPNCPELSARLTPIRQAQFDVCSQLMTELVGRTLSTFIYQKMHASVNVTPTAIPSCVG